MFDKLKEDLKKRIEKNAVKSVMSWKDGEGTIQSEVVYMKRSRIPLIGDWGRIYPPVNEDDTWNLINLIFGGRRNFIKLLLIIGLIALVFYGIHDLLEGCKALTETTCVQDCINYGRPFLR